MMRTQTNLPGETVWDHGVKVKNIYLQIYKALRSTKNQPKLLQSLKENYNFPSDLAVRNLDLLAVGIHWKTIRTYVKFHDCGKPFCKTVRPDGTFSFPDHAEVSKEKFLEFADSTPTDHQKYLAKLIGRDMEPHLLRGKDEEIEKFLGLDNKQFRDRITYLKGSAWTSSFFHESFLLLLVCFASIQSNYSKDSVAYKIAMKRWNKNVEKAIQMVRKAQGQKNG